MINILFYYVIIHSPKSLSQTVKFGFCIEAAKPNNKPSTPDDKGKEIFRQLFRTMFKTIGLQCNLQERTVVRPTTVTSDNAVDTQKTLMVIKPTETSQDQHLETALYNTYHTGSQLQHSNLMRALLGLSCSNFDRKDSSRSFVVSIS